MTVHTFIHLAEISGGMLYVIAVVLLIGLAVIVDRVWVLGGSMGSDSNTATLTNSMIDEGLGTPHGGAW